MPIFVIEMGNQINIVNHNLNNQINIKYCKVNNEITVNSCLQCPTNLTRKENKRTLPAPAKTKKSTKSKASQTLASTPKQGSENTSSSGKVTTQIFHNIRYQTRYFQWEITKYSDFDLVKDQRLMGNFNMFRSKITEIKYNDQITHFGIEMCMANPCLFVLRLL